MEDPTHYIMVTLRVSVVDAKGLTRAQQHARVSDYIQEDVFSDERLRVHTMSTRSAPKSKWIKL